MNVINLKKEIPKAKRTMRNECWSCQNKIPIAGSSHISCSKPDPEMIGNQHGIDMGWFYYPPALPELDMARYLMAKFAGFDPVWKEKDCINWEAKDEK